MVYLAMLNENNICTSVKVVKDFIDDGNHIELESMDGNLLWKKYDSVTQTWSDKKYLPDYAQIELGRMEKLEKENETLKTDRINTMKALVELHMEILKLKGES